MRSLPRTARLHPTIIAACIATLVVATVGAAQPGPRAPQTSAVAPSAESLVSRVDSVGFTVADLARAVEFFTTVLDFRLEDTHEVAGPEFERLVGVFGARARIAMLRLGEERLELTQFLAPSTARAIPPDSRSNDAWFQHIAIVVSDMDAAYARLRAAGVAHASTSPQRLPDWNPNAGGIRAFYFKDPEGHVLELIQFPAGKGDPKWAHLAANQPDRPFLGIDHTAIVVSDTERSLGFYRDVLGLRLAGGAENFGEEQERLNNVFGVRLRITGLRAPEGGPGVELLEYIAPSDGRETPRDSQATDLWHWTTRFAARASHIAIADASLLRARARFISPGFIPMIDSRLGFVTGATFRDPDWHALQIVSDAPALAEEGAP